MDFDESVFDFTSPDPASRQKIHLEDMDDSSFLSLLDGQLFLYSIGDNLPNDKQPIQDLFENKIDFEKALLQYHQQENRGLLEGNSELSEFIKNLKIRLSQKENQKLKSPPKSPAGDSGNFDCSNLARPLFPILDSPSLNKIEVTLEEQIKVLTQENQFLFIANKELILEIEKLKKELYKSLQAYSKNLQESEPDISEDIFDLLHSSHNKNSENNAIQISEFLEKDKKEKASRLQEML